MIVEPTVLLIASTQVHYQVDEGGNKHINGMLPDPDATDAENLVEACGRGCYESEDKPNPATRKNADYLERTIFNQAHGSIAEHASATVLLKGVSRSWLAEATRHRPFSFSVRSQRFVNEENMGIVLPPAVREHGCDHLLQQIAGALVDDYKDIVDYMVNAGLPRKQAREAARSVLPNMAETRLYMTGNLRAWVQFLERRLDPAADMEMREVAGLILDAICPVAPNIFKHVEVGA